MKVKVSNSLLRNFSKEMNIWLFKPLIVDELHFNVKSVTNGKSLVPNEFVIECYI
jgi:hypothetical protein